MADPVSLITGAILSAKRLYDLAVYAKNAEAQKIISDLNVALANVNNEIASLKTKNLRLEQELTAIRELAEPENVLEIRGDKYYLKEPAQGIRDRFALDVIPQTKN